MDDRRCNLAALKIFGGLLPDHPQVSREPNLAGGLQARKVPAMADVAGTRVVVIMGVPWQLRCGGHNEQRAKREQRDEVPDSVRWKH
jgi:hypothetical protein